MESETTIFGTCPFCKNSTSFRELSTVENFQELGNFIGSFFKAKATTKIQRAATIYNEMNSSRSFPNFKCDACNQTVMQCSSCKDIIEYEDTGDSHICGQKQNIKKSENTTNTKSENTIDIISSLERLATLREKGLLTQSEFEAQKSKLLQS